MTAGKKPTTRRPATERGGFSAEEREAMKARVRESRSAAADGEATLLAAIAAMPASDRALAARLHALITSSAPVLTPRTWYGMPAWARDGKVICFFQAAGKFKTRYSTLGFSDQARLDAGRMWPTSFALTTLTAAEEAEIVALLTRALTPEA